jgi:threonine/homoserine/homoserine lactone efflux protein
MPAQFMRRVSPPVWERSKRQPRHGENGIPRACLIPVWSRMNSRASQLESGPRLAIHSPTSSPPSTSDPQSLDILSLTAAQHSRHSSMIPSHSSLVLFLTAAMVLLLIPGPAVAYIVGRSVAQGRLAGVISALGIGVGTLVHVAAALLGLSALLMSSAIAFGVVKYLGAAYLIYLGVQKLRHPDSFETSGSGRTKLSSVFTQGIVVNVLNPKTALFFFAFLPQFVDASTGRVAGQIFFLGTLFALMGVLSDTLWALFAGTVARSLQRRSRWTRAPRYLSGGILISLGLATALSGSAARK